jgi:hypothetical protein
MKSVIKSLCRRVSSAPGLANIALLLFGIGIESAVRGVVNKNKVNKKCHKDPYIQAKHEFFSNLYRNL